MTILHKLVKNNDKYYLVIRTISETSDVDPKWFKYKMGVDHVFKAQGKYWFVNEITEAQVVPDLQYHLEFEN